MKKIFLNLFAITLLIGLFHSKAESQTFNIEDALSQLNSWCATYDPYTRVFTYNSSTKTLQSKSTYCTTQLPLEKLLPVYVKLSGSQWNVYFSDKTGSKSMFVDCTSFDEYDSNFFFYMTNEEYAYKVRDKINELMTSVLGTSTSSSNAISKVVSNNPSSNPFDILTSPVKSTSYSGGGLNLTAALKSINEWTATYDVYKRKFTFDSISGKLTFVTDDNCKVVVPLKKTEKMLVEKTGDNFSVKFSQLNEEKNIDVDCGSVSTTGLTSITITSQTIAEKLADKFNELIQYAKNH